MLSQILSVVNAFDQNSFALAWLEGNPAGYVIASKGNGVAPEWDASPPLTGLRLTGLTASALVATNGSKDLVSDTSNYIIGDGVNKITVGPTEPVDPQVGDIWIDVS